MWAKLADNLQGRCSGTRIEQHRVYPYKQCYNPRRTKHTLMILPSGQQLQNKNNNSSGSLGRESMLSLFEQSRYVNPGATILPRKGSSCEGQIFGDGASTGPLCFPRPKKNKSLCSSSDLSHVRLQVAGPLRRHVSVSWAPSGENACCSSLYALARCRLRADRPPPRPCFGVWGALH